MRMILGLDRPTSGTVTIGGQTFAELDNPLNTIGALLDARWVTRTGPLAGFAFALLGLATAVLQRRDA